MDPSRTEGPRRLLIRLVLVVVGLLLVWLADYYLGVLLNEFIVLSEYPLFAWIVFVVVGIVAGVPLGLALVLPSRFDGYRWGRVLILSIPPLALLVLGLVAIAVEFDIPRVILDLTFLFGGSTQGVIAVTLGAVLGAGFAERPRSDGGGGFSPQVGPPG